MLSNFLRRRPQAVIIPAQVLQIGVIEPARFVDTLGKLVEVVAGPPQQRYHLTQFRQLQIDYDGIIIFCLIRTEIPSKCISFNLCFGIYRIAVQFETPHPSGHKSRIG